MAEDKLFWRAAGELFWHLNACLRGKVEMHAVAGGVLYQYRRGPICVQHCEGKDTLPDAVDIHAVANVVLSRWQTELQQCEVA